MVVRVAPLVGEQIWRKERSCPGWDVLDPDARKVGLHDQPSDGETESHAAFAARLWRTARAPRIEFEGALFKGGSNYGESEFFGLSSSPPTVRYQRKPGSTLRFPQIQGSLFQRFTPERNCLDATLQSITGYLGKIQAALLMQKPDLRVTLVGDHGCWDPSRFQHLTQNRGNKHAAKRLSEALRPAIGIN